MYFNANGCLARIETFMCKKENINSFCKQNDTSATGTGEKTSQPHFICCELLLAVAFKKKSLNRKQRQIKNERNKYISGSLFSFPNPSHQNRMHGNCESNK